MSIAKAIVQLEKEKRLHRFVPRSRSAPRRRVYMSPSAWADYENAQSAVNMLVGKGYIQAALTRWSLGDRVFAHSGGKKGGFLKELDPPPPDVWELRVTEPVSHARLLGRFAEPDTLILTKLHTRAKLGNKGSGEWKAAMEQAVSEWESLFGDIPAMHGQTLNEYVTENCDVFPLKRHQD